MTTIIPLHAVRGAEQTALAQTVEQAMRGKDQATAPVDTRGRALHDLRISVTDRCNFRCVYCMPKDVFGRDYPFLPHAELLTFEEIARLASVFKAPGVE